MRPGRRRRGVARRTAIVRRAAGADSKAQTLAANVDTVLVLVAADGRVPPRSVERYVTLVWESGAVPVVALTKADLVSGDDLDEGRRAVEPACVGVHASHQRRDRRRSRRLAPYFGPGRTVALLGSSGAGKSTLANRLTGAGLATGEVRAGDGRGRHTTTHRELVPLPAGGVLVDTPGLREVGLWQADDGPRPDLPGDHRAGRRVPLRRLLPPARAGLRGAGGGGRRAGQRGAPGQLAQAPPGARPAGRPGRPALRQQLRTEQRRLHREYAQARKQWEEGPMSSDQRTGGLRGPGDGDGLAAVGSHVGDDVGVGSGGFVS